VGARRRRLGGAAPTPTWGGPTVHGNRGDPYRRSHGRRRRSRLARRLGLPARLRPVGPRRRVPGPAQRVGRDRGRRPGHQRRPRPARPLRGGRGRGPDRGPVLVRPRTPGPAPLARPPRDARPAPPAAPLGAEAPRAPGRAGDRDRPVRARGADGHHLLGRLPGAADHPLHPGGAARRPAVGGQRRHPRLPGRAGVGGPPRGHGRRAGPGRGRLGGHPPRPAPPRRAPRVRSGWR